MSRFFLFVVLFLSALSFAHGAEEEAMLDTWQTLGIPDPVAILYAAIIVSGVGIIAALVVKDGAASEPQKKFIFIIIAVPIALSTLYLAGTTIYLNIVSETGGPVHWHADYEIWACGERVDVADPAGFENRVGVPDVHEHGDDRIHIEGALLKAEEASLGRFFQAIGGEFSDDHLAVPAHDGVHEWENGGLCNGAPAKVQVFVYRIINAFPSQTENFEYEQFKANEDYVLSPYANVPPGDCIIVEFDRDKPRTDKICETYRVALENGNMREAS